MPLTEPTSSAALREPTLGCLACAAEGATPEIEVPAQMVADGDRRQRFRFVRCEGCGLVYLDPRVPLDALGHWYPEWYLPYRGSSAWGAFGWLVEQGQRYVDRQRVRAVLEHVDPDPGSVLLDVGCGRPTFVHEWVRSTGADAVGSDFSDAGWRDEPEVFGHLDLRAGPLELAADRAPYAAVTMWHYLEHDYAPRDTLRQVASLTRPGGRLVVEVPDYDSWTRRHWGEHWAGYHAPRHAALYTAATLRSLLEGAGWRVLDARRRGTLDPYLLDWMSRMEARGIDWRRSLAPRFAGFALGRLARALTWASEKGGLGFLTVVAERADGRSA